MANTNSNTKTKNQKQSKEVLVEEKVKPVVKDVDLSQYVVVKNGFQGILVYESSRTGEVFVWDNFGDEQEMELRELKNAKSSNKKFFENNWFMFEDDWVIDFLGVRQFYKHAVKIEDFDNLFEKSPTELKKALNEMSDGQKMSVSYRARTLINEGKIDSLKVISTIEDALGIELIEK